MATAADFNNKVQAYFVATLGRAASASELEFYSQKLAENTGGVWKAGLAQYVNNLAGLTTDVPSAADAGTMVTETFERMTGTAASSMSLTAYNEYVNRLVAGTLKPIGLANKMMNDMGLMPKADGTYGQPAGWATDNTAMVTAAEKTALENKVSAANTFTAALDTAAENNDFLADPSACMTWLEGVTDDASLTAAEATVDSVVAQAEETSTAGQTYTLTAAADNITGTSGNDTINGMADTTASSGQTLTAADKIAGGAGTDTLNVTVAGTAPASALNGADVSGVEVINIRGTIATAFDAGTVSGETEVNADRGTGAMTVTNMSQGVSYGIKGDGNTALGAQNVTWGGTATSFTVNIDGGVGPTGTTAPAVTLAGTGATTATINSTGAANKIGALALGTASTVTAATINASTNLTTGAVTAAALKTLTTTGAGTVDLDSSTTALAATVTKVDATANTGGTKVLLGANTTEFAGGAGNDFVSIDTLVFNATAKLAGGDGTDTLAIADNTATLFTAAAKANISGFETLQVSSGATKTFDFAALSGLTALNVNTATSAVVNNIGAATPVTIIGDQTTNMTLNVKDATVPTNMSDSLTITLDKAGSATTTSIVTVANITSDGLETLNIVSSGVQGNDAAVTTDNNAISSLAGLSTSAVTQVNISGASDLSLTTGAINKVVNIVSTGTGNMTINASGNNSATGITTGSGTDTLTGTAAADVISAGAGNDTITGGANGDTIDGGAGNDTYNYDSSVGAGVGSLVTALTAFDKVTVTSGDKFNDVQTLTAGTYTVGSQTTTAIGSAANLLSALTEVTKAGTTALTQYAGYLVNITDTGSTYAGTYLVIEDGTATGTVDAADTVIKLIGVGTGAALTATGGDLVLTFS